MDGGKRMGREKENVIFLVASNYLEISDTYMQFIEEIKEKICSPKISVVLKANAAGRRMGNKSN